MAIDLSTLDYQSRRIAGSDSKNQKSTYAVDFSSGGQNYTFIPSSVISKGVNAGETNYVLPWFLDEGNIGKVAKTGQYVDLAGQSWYGDYLKNTVGASTTGFLVPSGSLPFDAKMSTTKQEVKGIANTEDGPAYILDPAAGKQAQYISNDGKVTSLTQGRSLLGKVFGGVGDTLSNAVNETLSDINDLGPWVNAAIAVASPPTAATIAAANAGQAAATGDYEKAALSGAVAYGLSQAGDGLFGSSGTQAPVVDAGGAVEYLPGATPEAGALASSGTGLKATGSLDTLKAGTTENLGYMGAAQGLTGPSTVGTTLGATGGALTAGGLGAGLGLSSAALGAGTAAGLGAAGGALTASQLGTAGLISGGLNLAGGLLQGQSTQEANQQLAAQQAALAEKTMQMGKFQPVGITTRFGTSSFTTDPVTGAITPSYTLTPEAKAYQDALSGMATQGLQAGQGLMNLGQQYVGESPEAVRNRYIQTQQALLAPQQEQALAAIRNRQAATGRGGLAYGATSDGMMATNPEMAAYYNSLAQTQRQLAANAETQYQNQVNFGSGLLNQATTPFTNVFTAQKGVELQAQQPLDLSTNFANIAATRGAAQGANYATAMNPSLQAQYNAANYNPWASALQGAASNPLTGYGLMRATGLG